MRRAYGGGSGRASREEVSSSYGGGGDSYGGIPRGGGSGPGSETGPARSGGQMSYLRGAQSRTHSPGDEHSGRRTRY